MRREVKRGDNLRFIASYLFTYPCARPMQVIKALTAYNRVPNPSNSHYGEYVYHNCTYGRAHRFAHLWYRIRDNGWVVEPNWQPTHTSYQSGTDGKYSRGRIMLQLTAKGMSYVDLSLAEQMHNCEDLGSL